MITVLFGPITSAVIADLQTSLGVPCSLNVPNPRPSAWLRVLRTGGPRVDVVTEDAQLTIESWADSAATAEDNANRARQRLQQIRNTNVGGIPVYRVAEFSGPAYLPDPDSYQPRWTFTVALLVRGA